MPPKDITEAVYSAKTLGNVSGLSSVAVQQYSEREILPCESVVVGSRSYRKYSYMTLLLAACIAVIRRLGVTPMTFSKLVQDSKAAIGTWAFARQFGGAGLPTKQHNFVIALEGAPVVVFADGRSSLNATLEQTPKTLEHWHGGERPAMGRPCAFIAIDLAAIEAEVLRRLVQAGGKAAK